MNTKITNTIKNELLFGTYGHIRSLEDHQGDVEFYFGGNFEEDKFQLDLLIQNNREIFRFVPIFKIDLSDIKKHLLYLVFQCKNVKTKILFHFTLGTLLNSSD